MASVMARHLDESGCLRGAATRRKGKPEHEAAQDLAHQLTMLPQDKVSEDGTGILAPAGYLMLSFEAALKKNKLRLDSKPLRIQPRTRSPGFCTVGKWPGLVCRVCER